MLNPVTLNDFPAFPFPDFPGCRDETKHLAIYQALHAAHQRLAALLPGCQSWYTETAIEEVLATLKSEASALESVAENCRDEERGR